MFLGCAAMRRVKATWPKIGPVGRSGLLRRDAGFDIILEGVIFMLLGSGEYGGGRGRPFQRHLTHAFPLDEIVTVSATFTAIACLWFFCDDKGQNAGRARI